MQGFRDDILINLIFPLLDPISQFRLARCSKLLYKVLDKHLPRNALIQKYGWTFKTKSVKKRWKLARKRHESNQYCVECGKRRVNQYISYEDAIMNRLMRTQKPHLLICMKCQNNTERYDFNLYIDRYDYTRVIDEARTLAHSLKRRRCNNDKERQFKFELFQFICREHEQLPRINARIGDILIPKYYWPYNNQNQHYTVLDIKTGDLNEICYIVADGYIEDETGKFWKAYNNGKSFTLYKQQYILDPNTQHNE